MMLPWNELYMVVQTIALVFTMFQKSKHTKLRYTVLILLSVAQHCLWFYSRFKDINKMYWFSWVNFARMLFAIINKKNAVESNVPYIVFSTFALIMTAIIHWFFLQFVIKKNKLILNLLITVSLSIVMFYRLFGFDSLNKKHVSSIIFYFVSWPTILLGIHTLNQLNNFYISELIKINQNIKKNDTIKKVKEEYEDMFMTLEEGIAVFENMNINFSN